MNERYVDLEEKVPDTMLREIIRKIGADSRIRDPEKDPLWCLASFALRGDRREAPFFVGREEEIDHVEGLCEDTIQLARKGGRVVVGETVLFLGAPGAGKTAILEELDRRWKARRVTETDRVPVAVRMLPQILSDPSRVVTAIVKAISPRTEEDFRTTRHREHRILARIGAYLEVVRLKGGYDRKSGSSTKPREIHFEALADAVPPKEWGRPVCLMVDEIQDIGKGAKETISAVHQATDNLPIIPVFAGLGDSFEILKKRGGSPRLSKKNPYRIGCLEPGQPAEAVRKMLKDFRITKTPEQEREWADKIEVDTDLWPQHLHNAMTALARGLVDADLDLGKVNGNAVLELAERWRQESYDKRAESAEMRGTRPLVARILTDLPEGGLKDTGILHLIDSHVDDRQGWRMPKDVDSGTPMDNQEFLDHLVHHGVLLKGPDNRYTCPIPTFRDYLIEEGELDHPMPEKMS